MQQEGVEWRHEGIHHPAMYILVSQGVTPHLQCSKDYHLTECSLPLDDFRFFHRWGYQTQTLLIQKP